MYLDYSKLAFDKNGTPETPTLVLKTMHEETIGVIPGVYNLKLSVKFAEPSEMTFDVPAILDGEKNWIYDELVGYKVIYTEHYGIYVVMNPTTSADGISDVKHVQCYSLEKVLDTKKFFLEDGDDGSTFKFFNQTNHNDPDTIIGRVLEVADGWHMGYVAPSVAQRYRTFDGYDDYLMSFLYGDCQDKFHCVFVFDPYERSINVYDADIELETLPIYLDFDNLVESLDIEEVTDELVTAIRPYGSDDVDIREVNPIGSNWIYDLSYFIANGDLPDALAAKWEAWQRTVLNRRFKDKAICGEVNLPAMTMCEEANGYIFHGDKLLCVVTSENAHQFFARDDDGAGMLRGKLTQAIQKTLAKRDANYQNRWDMVWEDPTCQPYKRIEYADFWLWNHDFFNADIDTLRHIAKLVGAKEVA